MATPQTPREPEDMTAGSAADSVRDAYNTVAASYAVFSRTYHSSLRWIWP